MNKTGLLLGNTGSPEAPTRAALRRFLREFLLDPQVVDWPRPLWRPLLEGIVLTTRPARAARRYRRIWTAEGSPLLATSRRLAGGLAEALRRRHGQRAPIVTLGMRYGAPSLRQGLELLRQQGCRRMLILPLYPQWSGATTGSLTAAAAEIFQSWPDPPEWRAQAPYYDRPQYIEALAAGVRQAWTAMGPPDRILFSFHGLPESRERAGDPYAGQCRETARRLAETLGLPSERWQYGFQSRFGPGRWLQPETARTLARWGAAGMGRVDVLCPGFAVDCLETLEETAMDQRDRFLAAGGKEFHYLPALNDRPEHLALLADLADQSLQGWI